MKSVKEVKEELIQLGFVDYNACRDTKFCYINDARGATNEEGLAFLKDSFGFWVIIFDGSVFSYWDYVSGWVTIEEELSLESMILLYGKC